MNRMWSTLIRPIIDATNAKYIVEIGSESGVNTRNILEYCADNEARMTAIDPLPKFDINEFKKEFGDKFEIYTELSLNRLPLLKDYDAILLDGDHNWYTVYNELKIIEKSFKDKKFPIVFLHDVGWPYARRDLYYNPENIPEAFRQPYKKLGVYPNQTNLSEKGGLNPNLYNSIYESNPNNGVLTAVEDFLEESDSEFSFETINIFFGLGILFPKGAKMEKLVKEIIKNANLLDILEEERIDLSIQRSEYLYLNDSLKKGLNEKQIQLQHIKSQLNQKKEELESSNLLIKEKENLLEQTENKLVQAEERADIIENQLDAKMELLQIKEFHINSLERQLNKLGIQLTEVRNQSNKLEIQLTETRNQSNKLEIQLTEIMNQLNKLTREREIYIKTIEQQKNQLNDFYMNYNYRFLEMQYLNSDGRSLTQRLISKFPSLFILANMKKTGFKNALITIKGYKAIKQQQLFNTGYYLKKYDDVKQSGTYPLLHYIYKGYKENRNPSPTFSTSYYLKTYPDVDVSKINPLIHYSLYGIYEGRKTKKNLISQVRSDEYVICCCAKDEEDYILEWLDYNLNLGFDRIYIFDNNDHRKLSDYLKNYKHIDKVEIIEKHGVKAVQCRCYNEFLEKNNFKWCAFIDVDEFITLNQHSNIKEFLHEFDSECVLVNWMQFGTNEHKHKTNKHVQERFTRPVLPVSFDINRHVKSIIRKGTNGRFKNTPHCISHGESYCNSTGKKVEYGPFQDIDFRVAYIKHYYTKSLEEWEAKMKKPRASTTADHISNLFRDRAMDREYKTIDEKLKNDLRNFDYKKHLKEKDIQIKEVIIYDNSGVSPFKNFILKIKELASKYTMKKDGELFLYKKPSEQLLLNIFKDFQNLNITIKLNEHPDRKWYTDMLTYSYLTNNKLKYEITK